MASTNAQGVSDVEVYELAATSARAISATSSRALQKEIRGERGDDLGLRLYGARQSRARRKPVGQPLPHSGRRLQERAFRSPPLTPDQARGVRRRHAFADRASDRRDGVAPPAPGRHPCRRVQQRAHGRARPVEPGALGRPRHGVDRQRRARAGSPPAGDLARGGAGKSRSRVPAVAPDGRGPAPLRRLRRARPDGRRPARTACSAASTASSPALRTRWSPRSTSASRIGPPRAASSSSISRDSPRASASKAGTIPDSGTPRSSALRRRSCRSTPTSSRGRWRRCAGLSRKCLVLDLDNTLWGGVIGDDGLSGIVLGQGSATGEAYLAVQQMALALRARGVVLAVCSKNEEANARAPFREHPDMLLREDHIAVFQANWTDKAANLRAIAKTLNIGSTRSSFSTTTRPNGCRCGASSRSSASRSCRTTRRSIRERWRRQAISRRSPFRRRTGNAPTCIRPTPSAPRR